jgi:hypothetical protein
MKIHYSLGVNNYDNTPKQNVANSFADFQAQILSTRSQRKGETYFCTSFQYGCHTDKVKHPKLKNYRLSTLANPREFLAYDFDGFSTPLKYKQTMAYLEKFYGFGYETWSHTSTNPRARAILAISRPINNSESLLLSKYIEQLIDKATDVGNVKFDQCVYNIYQPIYSPPINAIDYQFNGKTIEVDEVLLSIEAKHSLIEAKGSKSELNRMKSLMGKVAPDETPRQIAILEELLSSIEADCDYKIYRRVIWAILSTEWACAESIALRWSMNAIHRFSQNEFDSLVRKFDPGHPKCPSIGSIHYMARVKEVA